MHEVRGKVFWSIKASFIIVWLPRLEMGQILLVGMTDGCINLPEPPISLIYLQSLNTSKLLWRILGSWDCGFCRHLKDVEIEEWAELTNLLAHIHLNQLEDFWVSTLDSKGAFSTKSLLHDLGPKENYFQPILAKSIWGDNYPKRSNSSFGNSHTML